MFVVILDLIVGFKLIFSKHIQTVHRVLQERVLTPGSESAVFTSEMKSVFKHKMLTSCSLQLSIDFLQETGNDPLQSSQIQFPIKLLSIDVQTLQEVKTQNVQQCLHPLFAPRSTPLGPRVPVLDDRFTLISRAVVFSTQTHGVVPPQTESVSVLQGDRCVCLFLLPVFSFLCELVFLLGILLNILFLCKAGTLKHLILARARRSELTEESSVCLDSPLQITHFRYFLLNAVTYGPVLYLLSAMQLS